MRRPKNDWAAPGPSPGRSSRVPVRASSSSEPSTPDRVAAEQISVLFCCLGNICRSTMAEGVFQSLTKTESYKDRIGRVDSCGTASYHTGAEPDDRTMATLRKYGITDYAHSARKVATKDFETFDYIFAMDRSNLADLERKKRLDKPDGKAKVMLFGEFSGTGRAEIVSDPYYGGSHGFEAAYEQAARFSANFLAKVFPDVSATPSERDAGAEEEDDEEEMKS